MSFPVFVVWLLAWNRSGCKGMTRREQSNCCCGGWVDCLEEKEMGVRVCVASSCGMHPPSGGVGNYDLAVPLNGDVHGEHFPPLWSPLVYCLLSLCLDATYLASDKAVSTAPNLSTNLAIEFLFPTPLSHVTAMAPPSNSSRNSSSNYEPTITRQTRPPHHTGELINNIKITIPRPSPTIHSTTTFRRKAKAAFSIDANRAARIFNNKFAF